jgi:Zn-dependent peptidase ImmA (M78 family)
MSTVFNTLLKRLQKAGFKKKFVKQSILPEWWTQDCEGDSSLSQDLEIRIARFLGVSLSIIRNSEAPLTPILFPNAHLRRVKDIDQDRLAPAIHTAIQIAGAVVRNLRVKKEHTRLPESGLDWRAFLKPAGGVVRLEDILTDIWQRGIPIIPVESLPTPSFQGLSCVVEGHPAIVLSYKYDEPGRVAHIIAHEAGHIAFGDCKPNEPVIDENEEVVDNDEMEIRAERFANLLLVGAETPPKIQARNFRELAEQAIQIEKESGTDAGAIIFEWAKTNTEFESSQRYQMATMAVKALWRGAGGRRKVQDSFRDNVDVDNAPESDRDILRCVESGDRKL